MVHVAFKSPCPRGAWRSLRCHRTHWITNSAVGALRRLRCLRWPRAAKQRGRGEETRALGKRNGRDQGMREPPWIHGSWFPSGSTRLNLEQNPDPLPVDSLLEAVSRCNPPKRCPSRWERHVGLPTSRRSYHEAVWLSPVLNVV